MIIIFIANQMNGDKKYILNKGNHPPKKKITFKLLINIILVYSPIKKKANPTDEYSTL
jgi:hypothetical protein